MYIHAISGSGAFAGYFKRFWGRMGKELCILHANCQGEPLLKRLLTSPEFSSRYECVLYTNYIKEPIPDDMIGDCALFLYQYLKPRWGELASDRLLAKLPDGARSLCVPNLFFKGYWPLWSGKQGFDYRCSLLDDVIDLGLPPEETVLLFLHTDVAKHNPLSLVSATIEQEREREKHTPVKYLDVILKNYREQRIFNTVNHPGSLLMNHVTRGVLAELGMEPADDGAMQSLGDPFPEFEQPINPKIGDFFGWDFAGVDTEYEVYGRKMTFARYVSNYVVAKQIGAKDFIGFLQGDHVAI